jgi:hypothetical protein
MSKHFYPKHFFRFRWLDSFAAKPATVRLLILVLVATPLVAGTVSVQATADLPLRTDNACGDSDVGFVTCSIFAIFSDSPTSHNVALSEGTARADFGSLSGAMYIDGAAISGFYESSFSDFVTILGGSGTGTLTTHYLLFSSDEQIGNPGQAVPPFYRFIQGGTIVEHTPNLPQLPDMEDAELTENLDITSSIVFGTAFPLGAGTRVSLAPRGHLDTKSTLTITGFTVLDSAGDAVPGATVQRGFSPVAPNVFVPEPDTSATGICSTAILIVQFRRQRGGAALFL